jgi:Ribonuclease G/E
MSERRLYIDACFGETRGVVTLDGRPERLLIERDGDNPAHRAGAKLVARVRKLDRASALAFLDLGDAEGVLNLGPETHALTEGAAIEVELRAEARRGKSAVVRCLGPAEGAPRLIEPAASLEERLAAHAPGVTILTGAVARSVADGAQEEVFGTDYPLPGGGTVSLEPTRALVAVDVDLGDRPGAEAKRAARAANFAAINAAARLLRLKGLGGLIVIDLVGRGHDAPALLSGARNAFAPDNPGVALAAISRFGALELTVPRRTRPTIEILADETGGPSALTRALDLVRLLEREATGDGGGRFEALAAPEVAAAAAPALAGLIGRVGARVSIVAEAGRGFASPTVRRL